MYVGETHRDLPWGEGKYTFANGDVYVGNHFDGFTNGKLYYSGQWKKDKFHGHGTMYYKDGIAL